MLAGEAKALHTTKRSSGIDVSGPELAQAWTSVQQDSDPQNWCAFTYAEVCMRNNLCLMMYQSSCAALHENGHANKTDSAVHIARETGACL